jgi:N-acetylglutamate synthase-like GNAT family acetyltransferase
MSEGPVWVARSNEVVVGTAAAVPKGERLYLRGMAVDPVARGGKIGCKLLARAEEFAIENGFVELFLSTTPFLSRAIHLYEQYGFCRSKEGPDELFGTPLFTMGKTLRGSVGRKQEKLENVTPGDHH